MDALSLTDSRVRCYDADGFPSFAAHGKLQGKFFVVSVIPTACGAVLTHSR